MQAEDLLKTSDLLLGFPEMGLKGLLELRVIRLFHHFRKRVQDLLLSIVNVAQGMHGTGRACSECPWKRSP
jgi:hypothetical protein